MARKGEAVPTSKAQKARDLIAEFPHTSKKELGKILFARNPILFKDEEDGRDSIRKVTDAHGTSRREMQSKDYKGPLSIPRGDINDFSHYKVTGEKIGMLYDVHMPYHDFDALSIAVEDLQRQKVDTIILGGDILDCYQISSFNREPDKMGIKYEIDMVCNFLHDLKKLKAKIIFKFGNHSERFENFIIKKAPELWGIECFQLDNLIRIQYQSIFNEPLECDFVKNKRIMDIGHLAAIHAHEFGESAFSPVNAARGFYLRAKANVIGGHQHQTSEHTESNINGKIVGAWSVGCLCDLHPKYRPINKWNHGFAIVKQFKDGSFEVHNKKIIDGKIV